MGVVSVGVAGVVAISKRLSLRLAGSLVCLGRTLASAQLPLTSHGVWLALAASCARPEAQRRASGSPVPLAASCPWHHSLCCSLRCGALREETLQTCTSSAAPHLPLPEAAPGTHSPPPVSPPGPAAHFFNSRPLISAGRRAILQAQPEPGDKAGSYLGLHCLGRQPPHCRDFGVLLCFFPPNL